MRKHISKIIVVSILFILIVYGWSMLQKINHNRLVSVSDIYVYVPKDARTIINFSRNYHFDDYFAVDSTNAYVLKPLLNSITFPVLVVKFANGEDLLLMKATSEQQDEIKKIFENKIAPYHAPSLKRYNGADLNFYSLSNQDFIISCFHDGIYAVSKDYVQIENFIDKQYQPHLFDLENVQLSHYISKIKERSPVSVFVHSNNTTFILSYTQQQDTIILDGKYFGKLEEDSAKLSYNEMNLLLDLENYYTDSILWNESNKVKVWLNKVY